MVLCSIVFSIEFFMKSFKEPDSDVVKINNINEKRVIEKILRVFFLLRTMFFIEIKMYPIE